MTTPSCKKCKAPPVIIHYATCADANRAQRMGSRPWVVGEINPRTDDEHVPRFEFPTQAEAEEFLGTLPDVASGRYYIEPLGER